MDFDAVVRSRRMVRAFEPRPVPAEVLDRVLELARRVPAAGNTQGLDLVVLEGPEQTARYWDASLPPERRAGFPWPGLLAAPVLIVPVGDPAAYVARYAEPDKARTGLGEGVGAWTVPYWYVDTAFAAMVALLAAVDEGLGALFFGQFDHEAAIAAALGIPPGRRAVGTIALGYAAADGDRPSVSSQRPRRRFDDIVHRGHW
jgi:nitroreductase